MLIIICLFSSIAGSVAILTRSWFALPFVWITVLWATAFGVLAVGHKQTSLRILWINLSAVAFTLGAVEFYFHTRETEKIVGTVTEMVESHQVLGYAPVPGRQFESIEYHGNELIYDVRYTINERGLRVSPPARQPSPCGSVLFFGGSLTFGEGVEDDQTMPYLSGIMTGENYSIYNLGFSGYGPHQMLAALENGIVDQMVREPVSYVIYQAIPDHVARAAGRAIWDTHGPKYVLNRDGKLVYEGPFDGWQPSILRWLNKQLKKSALYRWLGTLRREEPARDQDIALFTAIVAAARDAVVRKHPRAEFHAVLWSFPGENTSSAMRNGLRLANVKVHSVNKILADFPKNPAAYEISPFDTHPNPRAYEGIAAYVSTRILHGGHCRYTAPLAMTVPR
jgi:hypothetical protein